MKIIMLVIALLLYIKSYSQTKSVIDSLKNYITNLDSAINVDDAQLHYVRGIVCGKIVIKKVTKKKTVLGFTKTKKVTRNCGFGEEYWINNRNDTMFKVTYHDNVNYNYYLNFYYKNNKLIYANVSIIEFGSKEKAYFREEYYNDTIIVYKKQECSSKVICNDSKLSLNLIQESAKYYDKYIGDK